MALLFDQIVYQLWQADSPLYEKLVGLPVYDFTDCLEVTSEIANISADMPKRPPHDDMWIEWTQSKEWNMKHSNCTHSTTCGVRIKWLGTSRNFDGSIGVFAFMSFLRENGGRYMGIPLFIRRAQFIVFYSEWKAYKNIRPTEIVWNEELGIINVTPDLMHDEGGSDFPLTLMCLLHCRNIGTETVHGVPLKPREIRHGRPPKTDYKVLRLNLPSTLRPKGIPAETPDEAAKMRRHLCRGHFKNLQHERYKEKGWHWWPAHWRGDVETGTIDKVYKASASNEQNL